MTLIGTTIATTTKDLTELMQHMILHKIEGRVNLTISEDGAVKVWQPENMPIAESPQPEWMNYTEPQPTDQCTQ
jgi:hypothetical protein